MSAVLPRYRRSSKGNYQRLLPEGECAYCDKLRASGESIFPPHEASVYCQSGHHPHCTCDTCF